MPSTYTGNLGIEKPGDGEQSGLWGQTVNRNSDILDRAINGSVTLSLSGTSSTLTTADGSLSNGQYKMLVLGGAPSGAHTITISPNYAQKIYIVSNTTAQDVTFTQGSGGNVTVPAGSGMVIRADGAGSGAEVSKIVVSTLSQLGVTATAAELNYLDITTLGVSQASKAVTANGDGLVKFSNAVVEQVYALSGTSVALDPDNGMIQTHTLSGNTTYTDSLVGGGSMTLMIDDGSAYAVTWPTITWKTGGGVAPVLLTTGFTVVVLWKVGTTLYGARVGSV